MTFVKLTYFFKYTLLLLFIVFSFYCDDTDSNNSNSPQIGVISQSYFMGALVIVSTEELPTCNAFIDGQLYYIKSKKEFTFCDGSTYQKIDLINIQMNTTGSIQWQGTHTTKPIECTPETVNYAYYNSILKQSRICDGSVWQTLSKDGDPGENGISILWQGSHSSAPFTCDNITINYAYYDNTQRKSYICDGNSWEILAQNVLLPPAVVDTSPKSNSREFSLIQDITIIFNNPMNEKSIHSETISVTENGVPITGTISCLGRVVTFSPTNYLKGNRVYRVAIAPSITDIYNISLSYTHSYTFSTKGWQPPIALESFDTYAYWPRVSMDQSGNILAVWAQSDGSKNNVYSNYFNQNTGWGTATLVESNDTEDTFLPNVKMNSAGIAFSLWRQHDAMNSNMWINKYIPGVGWQLPKVLEIYESAEIYSARLNIDATGSAMVIWHQNSSFYCNQFTEDSNWNGVMLIENINVSSGVSYHSTMNGNGNVLLIWFFSSDGTYKLFGKHYDIVKGWEATSPLHIQSGSIGHPQVSIDEVGNGFVIWSQSDGMRNNIWISRFDKTEGWKTAELLESINEGHAINPQIAMDKEGNATAVWKQFDGTQHNIYANRYSMISGWGTPKLIEFDNSGISEFPHIAMDAQGNAIAVWSQSNGTIKQIWANRYTVGFGWGEPELLGNGSMNIIEEPNPKIALNDSGKACVVWDQFDGTKNNVLSVILK